MDSLGVNAIVELMEKANNTLRYIFCGAYNTSEEYITLKDEEKTRFNRDELKKLMGMFLEVYEHNKPEPPEAADFLDYLKRNENLFSKLDSKRYRDREALSELFEGYLKEKDYTPSGDEVWIKYIKTNGCGINNINNYKEQLRTGDVIYMSRPGTGISVGYIDHAFNYVEYRNYGTKILIVEPIEGEHYFKMRYEVLGDRFRVIKSGDFKDPNFVKNEVLPLMSEKAKDCFFNRKLPDRHEIETFNNHYGSIDKIMEMGDSFSATKKMLRKEMRKYESFELCENKWYKKLGQRIKKVCFEK